MMSRPENRRATDDASVMYQTFDHVYGGACGNRKNTKLGVEIAETLPADMEFPLHADEPGMSLRAELLSNQYASFATVSKDWKAAWGVSRKRRKP